MDFRAGQKNKFGIDAVFSTEPLRFPEGEACEANAEGITGLNCAGFGSSMTVTATFGLVAAAQVLRKLAESASEQSAMPPVAVAK